MCPILGQRAQQSRISALSKLRTLASSQCMNLLPSTFHKTLIMGSKSLHYVLPNLNPSFQNPTSYTPFPKRDFQNFELTYNAHTVTCPYHMCTIQWILTNFPYCHQPPVKTDFLIETHEVCLAFLKMVRPSLQAAPFHRLPIASKRSSAFNTVKETLC